MEAFIEAIENKYRAGVRYHNSWHEADVVNNIWMLMAGSKKVVTPLEQFAGFVAAMVHDVDHGGFSNNYLVQTGSALALRYNDASPLENMHLSTALEVAKSKFETDIFATLPENVYRATRKRIIQIVIGERRGAKEERSEGGYFRV